MNNITKCDTYECKRPAKIHLHTDKHDVLICSKCLTEFIDRNNEIVTIKLSEVFSKN